MHVLQDSHAYGPEAARITRDQRDRCMSLALQLRDYRVTTAEILYHLPDHPGLLQTYVWQDLDLAPRYPALRRFLDFWARELDGKLHSIKVASGSSICPAAMRHTRHLMHLH